MAVSADAAFIERVREAIEDGMSDGAFGVEALASAVGMSRVQLYRRVRDVLGEAPVDLIRRMRLERAAQLLAARSGSVSEVGYAVGFNSLSYFSKCFRERFTVPPSAYTGSQYA
jgi:AraC-like DNA-binding protein